MTHEMARPDDFDDFFAQKLHPIGAGLGVRQVVQGQPAVQSVRVALVWMEGPPATGWSVAQSRAYRIDTCSDPPGAFRASPLESSATVGIRWSPGKCFRVFMYSFSGLFLGVVRF